MSLDGSMHLNASKFVCSSPYLNAVIRETHSHCPKAMPGGRTSRHIVVPLHGTHEQVIIRVIRDEIMFDWLFLCYYSENY